MNRIIPPDDFPSAWDAGVGDYLAHQFEGGLSSQLEAYRLGLEALDTESQAFAGTGFIELNTESQDLILKRLETGQVILTWSVNPATFFHMVVEHVMEGFYSDSGNGGNRDSVSWQMIGFERRE